MLRNPAPTNHAPLPPLPVLPAPSPALATCASSPDSGTASPGSPLGPLPSVQLLATPTFDTPLFSTPEAMVAVAAAPAAPTRMVTPWVDSDSDESDDDDNLPLARRVPRTPTRSSSLRRRLRAQRRSTSSTAPRRPDAPVVVTAAHLRQLDVLGASVDALRRAFHAFKATREGKYAQLVTHVRAVQVLVAQAFREIEEVKARVGGGVGEVTPRVAPVPIGGTAKESSGALAKLRDAIAMAEVGPRRANVAGGARAQAPVVTFADAMPAGARLDQRHPPPGAQNTNAAAPIRPPRPRSDALGSMPRLAPASTSSTAPPQPVVAATGSQSNMTALAQLLESAETPSLMPVWSGPSGDRVGIGLQPAPAAERTSRNHHPLTIHKPVRAAHPRVAVPSPRNRHAPGPAPVTGTASASVAAPAPPPSAPVPTTTSTTATPAPPPPRPFASMSSALAMPSAGPAPATSTPGTGAMADLANLLEYASSDPRRAPPPPLYCTRPARPTAPAAPGPRNAQLAWPALGGPPAGTAAPLPPPALRAVASAPAPRTAESGRRGARVGAGSEGEMAGGARVRAPS
ncbi:hypothetical protein AMAG_09271 [Allomyces macrogynus ATCC 38327]|uniref:Uncharacterized protein n=1 Tax=Allomyces macrogynus (strain ATCC 38327) TaxID=578462 RepID=A0A0L0SP11_ALLM3|nr:hypothetical protein AMAG_09271 [Allomyces macrogynus ATCC 38327]|eukprot:KNE64232.1 hypothetical protein AMAG_09271 [Allomyces macrogynus ATCC 38327]